MAGPLGTLEQSARSLATGNLTIQVPQYGGDEIGRTAAAMGSMVTDLNVMIANIQQNGKSVTDHAAGVATAADSLQDIFGKLHDAVQHVREDAAHVLESTNTAMGQLQAAADTARGTSQSAATNSAEIKETADEFQRFQRQMEQTVEFNRELMKKVAAIRSIAGTIDDISSQAHLLALNAAIEAARAGEHGRGFAVVADEVGKLAHRSLSATAEISSLTQAIATSTTETVELLERTMGQAHENISRLLVAAKETANSSQHAQQMQSSMQSIARLISEQGKAVMDINGTMNGLSQLSQGSMDQTESLHELSNELNHAATGLNSVVERFQLRPAIPTQRLRRTMQ
jgi:methyl-accepting chemotaxis protein